MPKSKPAPLGAFRYFRHLSFVVETLSAEQLPVEFPRFAHQQDLSERVIGLMGFSIHVQTIALGMLQPEISSSRRPEASVKTWRAACV